MVDVEPVEMRTILPPEMQQVLEATRGDERGPRPLALEQCVRGDGRPVCEPIDSVQPGLLEHRAPPPRRRILLPGAGRYLRRMQPALGQQGGVGERAADVDAEDRHPAHSTSCDAHGGAMARPALRRGGEGRQLPAQLLDLVAQLGRVLEAQLLGGREHLLLERDHELLHLVLAQALHLGLATAAAARHRRRLEREELGDVGDALVMFSGVIPCSSL